MIKNNFAIMFLYANKEDRMKKIFILTAILLTQLSAFAVDNAEVKNSTIDISGIGFHKRLDVSPQQQIKSIFDAYQKYSNNQNLEKLLNLYDDTFRSSDGYDKSKLRELAQEVWKNYPDVKYDIKILSTTVDVDNATVITQEKLYGTVDSNIEYVKGKGYIDSESTAIYYLKRFSNEWRITSDFVINEKTAMRYGLAKFIPMQLDSPSIVAPDEEYTAILKINLPNTYKALVSIDNEPISYPIGKNPDTFRSLKSSGIQERILKSNNDDKNENATASVGIVKANIKDDNINVNIVGLAFLSSRVNVAKHKSDNFNLISEKSVQGVIDKEITDGKDNVQDK